MATVLRAQDGDPHPDSDLEAGGLTLRAGKHEDGDQYTVMADKQLQTVRLETVAVYEAAEPMSKREAIEFARDRAVDDPDIEVNG